MIAKSIESRFVLVLLIACFGGFGAWPLAAQQLDFERLSSELGLSQNMITCLMQDNKGFLWVGTKDGMNRFDGYRFKVFRNDAFDSTSISNNYINDIAQDKQGRIWVCTFKGLNLFDPEKEVFQHIFPNAAQGHDLSSEKTRGLLVDAKGRLWLHTDDNCLHLLEMPADAKDAKHLKITRMAHLKNESGSLVSISVKNILQDKKGVIWLDSHTGLYRIREEVGGQSFIISRKFQDANDPNWQKELEGLGESQNKPFTIGSGKEGSVWVACADQIGLWDPEAVAWQRFPLRRVNKADQNFYWKGTAELTETNSGNVWISFINGLLHFNAERGTSVFYTSDKNPDHPLHSGAGPLLQDKGGLLWVGTKGNGLLKQDRQANRFAGKIQGDPANFLYKGESLRAICKTADGQIWLSTSAMGFYHFDYTSSSIVPANPSESVLTSAFIFSILEDASGVLWLAGSQGLSKISRIGLDKIRIDRTFRPVPESDKPKHNYIWKVIAGKDGALWMLTSTSLCHFDPKTETFTLYPYLPEKNFTILNNEFPTLYQDTKGLLWIGTSEGLLRFDPAEKRFQHFQNDPKNPASLNQNTVKAIAADPTNPGRYLWIGTGGGGLNRFDQEKKTFESFTEKDGLPDQVVYAVLPDAAGNLWLSTNKGLSVFDPATRRFRNFDEKDGLQNLEFNSAAYFKSSDGQLFFGGIRGMNGFYPERMLQRNNHVPPIVFTDFKVSNRSISIKDLNAILTTAISYEKKIVLNPDVKIISFEFAALDFSEPSKNQFACKMEGFDPDWQYLGAVHSATYTNLSPGTYTFRVRGTNNAGVWNDEGASIEIIILSPWWATWWAYTLYVLVIGALSYAFYQLQRKRNQEKAETRRLHDLNEAKSQFLSTVSHELRTPLTSILGFSKIIKNRMEERILPKLDHTDPKTDRTATQIMDNLDIVIGESERLSTLINEVLDLAKIESGKLVWHEKLIDMGQTLGQAMAAMANQYEQKGIELINNIDPDLPKTLGDPDRLFQVVINLLSNALKFTEQGAVTCSARRQGENTLQISIADTGIGIPEDARGLVFEKFSQVISDILTDKPQGTGLGLPICKEIVEHHGGRIWVESELGKGSSFFFTLQVDKALKP